MRAISNLDAVLRNGLAAEYLMNGSGTTLVDTSGNGNNGTIYGAAWYTLPSGYKVLSFDGENDYVNTSLDPSAELGQNITVSVWVKPSSQSDYRGVVGAYYMGHGGFLMQYIHGWTFGVYHPDLTRTEKNIGDLPLNIWTHLTMVAKGGTNGYLKGYKDGVEVTPSVSITKDLQLWDCCWVGRAFVDYDRYFDGLIGVVHIYNRVLQPWEIEAIYNYDKALMGI
ncbi:MAG: LamG domain-containing protein [Methanosarcinales archaeon]